MYAPPFGIGFLFVTFSVYFEVTPTVVTLLTNDAVRMS